MIIGLTGGIAVGKSSVSDYLRKMGAEIIDTDKISSDIIEDRKIINNIVEEFGENILSGKKINKKKLRKIIFENSEKREKLNKIMHPSILEKVKENISKYEKNKIVIVDMPLLYEVGFEKEVEKVIVVYCSLEIQLSRIIKRDNVNYEEALNTIKSQMDIKEKIKKADYLIENNGTIDELKNKIYDLIKNIKNTH